MESKTDPSCTIWCINVLTHILSQILGTVSFIRDDLFQSIDDQSPKNP